MVLKVCMTQLVFKYRAFLAALEAAGPEVAVWAEQAVPVASLVYEIKRMTRVG